MAKKKIEEEGGTALATMAPEPLPDFLRADAPVGVEDKGESRVTPRIKLVQSMSDEELIEEFGAGAVLIGDQQTQVCGPEGSFVAIPIYQFPTWEAWKDVNDKSSDNPVEAVVFNPGDPIAAKAKARAVEPYGNGFKRSYVESLNVIVEIQDGPAAGQVVMASYSRGSAKVGRRLKGYLQRTGADIFAHRMEFFPDKARNAKGHWFVLNFRPSKPAWVSKADHERLGKVYADLDKAYKAGAIATAPPAAEAGEDVE